MKRVLFRLLIVMAVLVPAAAASVLSAQAATATIALQPTSGPPTTHVQVVGNSFAASETVKIFFDNTQVATVTANSAGQFITSFNVPASAQPGSHTVKAVGQTSGKTATASFLVRTNWPQFRFSWPHWGFQPFENTVSQANVASLTTFFTGDANGIVDFSSPAVANGVAYVGAEDHLLYAFPAWGCGSSSCSPLWTADVHGSTGSAFSSPAVDNGKVFLGSGDDKLFAFNANGCGSPTCSPLWTATTGDQIYSSPSVFNGVVYVGSLDGKLYALRASNGTPLWTGNTGGWDRLLPGRRQREGVRGQQQRQRLRLQRQRLRLGHLLAAVDVGLLRLRQCLPVRGEQHRLHPHR